MSVRVVVGLATLAAALLAGCAGTPPDAAADLVLVNGHVITLDEANTEAEAIAVRGRRVMAVGTNAEVEALAGPATERVDLAGQTVTPALMDAHAHFAMGAVARMFTLDLSYPNVQSIDDIVALVAEQVQHLEPGEWVRGRGWDEGKLDELRYLYAADLDSVSPENPVFLAHTMGHYGTANSRALAMAGIDRSTPDPVGGTIDRYDDGRPTGVLKEDAQNVVHRLIPPLGADDEQRAVAAMADAFNAECMTGAKDPGIGFDTWDSYQRVLADGDLTVRIFALWSSPRDVESGRDLAGRVAPFTKPYLSAGDDHLISGGIKIYADGSGGARTAWMYEDWSKDFDDTDTGNRGYPATDPDVLRELVKIYHDAGLHVSIHAIGDRAIDWVVDSYAMAMASNPIDGLRHGIIHANIPTDRAIGLMARLQDEHDAAYPEPSPGFMWWIGDTYAGNFGPERDGRLNPFHTFQEHGIRWASSSDYPVTPFPARYGVWASLVREPVRGVYGDHPFGMSEAVDIETALRSYTTWAAHQFFLEDVLGSIEPGKYADLAVWDRDPYSIPPDSVKDMSCQLTLFDGDIVFRASD